MAAWFGIENDRMSPTGKRTASTCLTLPRLLALMRPRFPPAGGVGAGGHQAAVGLLRCNTANGQTVRIPTACHSNNCRIASRCPPHIGAPRPQRSQWADGANPHGVSQQQVPNRRPVPRHTSAPSPPTQPMGRRCESPRRVTATTAELPAGAPQHIGPLPSNTANGRKLRIPTGRVLGVSATVQR